MTDTTCGYPSVLWGGEASTQVPHRSVAFHLWLILSRNLVAALAVRLSTSNQLVNDKEQLYHNLWPCLYGTVRLVLHPQLDNLSAQTERAACH